MTQSFMGTKASLPWYGLAIIVVLLDQCSKHYVVANFDYATPLTVTSFFDLTLLHNTGAAFSFLSNAGGWQRWFFAVIAILISAVLIVWLARLDTRKRFEACAIALVLGGAIGNLYDRLLLGYVVDFIVVHYDRYYWPAFNVADSAICIGALMLVIDSFRRESQD